MHLMQQGKNYFIEAASYQFYYYSEEALRATIIWQQNSRLKVSLVPIIHTVAQKDNVGRITSVDLEKVDDHLIIHLYSQSRCWRSKQSVWRLFEDHIEHYAVVADDSVYRIEDLIFFPEDADSGTLSEGTFNQVFSPVPNKDFHQYFLSTDTIVNSVGATQFHGGSGFFSPAPHFFAFKWQTGDSLAVGLLCKPAQHNFSQFIYKGLSTGHSFCLTYDSATECRDIWQTPTIMLKSGKDEFKLLKEYCSFVYDNGFATRRSGSKPSWWYGPIFCGWGEQCSEAMRRASDKTDHLQNIQYARQAASQYNYERWLKILLEHAIKPRILIIDDGWAHQTGSSVPHPERWYNMRAFIDACHEQGIKVLLWWNCFESDVASPEETIQTADYKPFLGLYGSPCADPTNPGYITRLRSIIHQALSSEQDCLNADGFKVDINGSIPTGAGFLIRGNVWGVELMKSNLMLIYNSARAIRDDVLIESHTAHPYFNDCIDMLRLNDIFLPENQEIQGMLFRYKISRAASPDWLIDTDGWPLKDLQHLNKYVPLQPELGVPSLYYALSLGKEPISFSHVEYSLISSTWQSYLDSL